MGGVSYEGHSIEEVTTGHPITLVKKCICYIGNPLLTIRYLSCVRTNSRGQSLYEYI
jgi:hypothetical protein